VGKTTTKEMLAFCLRDKFKVLKNNKTENNILGVAKTIFALNDEKIMILELGTNHPGEIKTLAQMALPDVGVITFIKPVHWEGFGSLNAIYQEKISLLRENRRIKAVLNADDNCLRKVDSCKKVFWFGKSNENNVYGRLINSSAKESVFIICDKYELKLATPFAGFISNAMAAIAAAGIKNISLKTAVGSLSNFNDFPKSRMELKEINGFTIIDDSYNSNPYAFCEVLKSLGFFPYTKIAVVGDMRELGDKSIYYHKSLAGSIIKSQCAYCLTIGDEARYLNEELRARGGVKAFHFFSHKDIADFIKKETRRGNEGRDKYLIFLKGSRKMELEKVIEELKTDKA
jgi:UDP-N-acetylmuramoyl-tripeptide--D-alanyl-D-alanine ligase